MRDLVLLIIIVGSIPISFFEPFYGILVWTWIAYFSPHRFTYSYMYNFPVAEVIAIPTLLGLFFTRKVNRNIVTRETSLLFVLWVWFIITYLNATQVPLFQGNILEAKADLILVTKILLMTVVMILLVTTRERLKYLFLVTAFSFTLLVIRGTAWGLLTGGGNTLWGPPGTLLEDNNGFALAVNMSLPILFYLGRIEENRLLRRILNVAFVCGIISVILTYSRGGLLGLAAVLLMIAWKSRYRVVSGFLLFACGFLILTFAPQRWTDRMATLTHDGVDDSAQQRLVAWETTWNFAKDYPIAGGSFRSLPNPDLFQRYQSRALPGNFSSTAPHSIYFQTLGEQGFVGLGLYLLLVGWCLSTLRSLRKRGRLFPAARWMVPYSDIIETSFVGFLVSGAFLGLANFDLFYQMVACTVILKIIYRREMAVQTSSKPLQVPLSSGVEIEAV